MIVFSHFPLNFLVLDYSQDAYGISTIASSVAISVEVFPEKSVCADVVLWFFNFYYFISASIVNNTYDSNSWTNFRPTLAYLLNGCQRNPLSHSFHLFFFLSVLSLIQWRRRGCGIFLLNGRLICFKNKNMLPKTCTIVEAYAGYTIMAVDVIKTH